MASMLSDLKKVRGNKYEEAERVSLSVYTK
jgi:hypothetical protein